MKKILIGLLLLGYAVTFYAAKRPYTIPMLFIANDNSLGKYFKSKDIAIIGEDTFEDIIIINSDELHTKSNKKLKKDKIYLGFYSHPTELHEAYYFYGTKKIEDKAPDSDVLTMIAIKDDYGFGE